MTRLLAMAVALMPYLPRYASIPAITAGDCPYCWANCLTLRYPAGMPAETCACRRLRLLARRTIETVSGVLGSVVPKGVYSPSADEPMPWETLTYPPAFAPLAAAEAAATASAETNEATRRPRTAHLFERAICTLLPSMLRPSRPSERSLGAPRAPIVL